MNSESMQQTVARVIVGLVMAFVLWQLVIVIETQSEKYLMHAAVNDCLQSGYEEYANLEQGSKAVVPSMEAYNFCIGKKGYSSLVKK